MGKPLGPVSKYIRCLNDEVEQPRIVDWSEAVAETSHGSELGQVGTDSYYVGGCVGQGFTIYLHNSEQ